MELIKQQHNVSAWVAEYSDALYRYAAQRLKDKDDAADMVQETFLSAWRSVAQYNGEASVKTWLFTILKNKLIDHYRKAASRQTESLSANDDAPFFDEADHWRAGYYPKAWSAGPEAKMETKEFFVVFNGCKGKLKELHDAVFTMKYVDGLKSEEICKVLNLSSSNYWVLIHRAKVQLRACLEMNWFTG